MLECGNHALPTQICIFGVDTGILRAARVQHASMMSASAIGGTLATPRFRHTHSKDKLQESQKPCFHHENRLPGSSLKVLSQGFCSEAVSNCTTLAFTSSMHASRNELVSFTFRARSAASASLSASLLLNCSTSTPCNLFTRRMIVLQHHTSTCRAEKQESLCLPIAPHFLVAFESTAPVHNCLARELVRKCCRCMSTLSRVPIPTVPD